MNYSLPSIYWLDNLMYAGNIHAPRIYSRHPITGMNGYITVYMTFCHERQRITKEMLEHGFSLIREESNNSVFTKKV